MPDEHPDIAAQLLRGLRRQTYAMVLLYLIVACAIGYVWWQENRTHTALCTLRGDLAQRVLASQDFLAKHPHGLDGISAASLQQSIAGQERTIQALFALHCADTTAP